RILRIQLGVAEKSVGRPTELVRARFGNRAHDPANGAAGLRGAAETDYLEFPDRVLAVQLSGKRERFVRVPDSVDQQRCFFRPGARDVESDPLLTRADVLDRTRCEQREIEVVAAARWQRFDLFLRDDGA